MIKGIDQLLAALSKRVLFGFVPILLAKDTQITVRRSKEVRITGATIRLGVSLRNGLTVEGIPIKIILSGDTVSSPIRIVEEIVLRRLIIKEVTIPVQKSTHPLLLRMLLTPQTKDH